MSSAPYPHIIEKIEDWPISKFAANRNQFISKLIEYTYNKIEQDGNSSLEDTLSKTIYLEKNRSRNNKWKVDPANEEAFWISMGKTFDAALLDENKDEQLKQLLKRIINRYSEEIISDFNPKTFKLARKLLTSLFKKFFNRFSSKSHFPFWGRKKDLINKFQVYGHIDELRALFEKGTVIIVPTHYSNIDSQVIGYVLDQIVGVPAFLYGAGLNLFDYEILAYYLNRLGTYRVDRRKKNPIYLTTLKSMSSLSIVQGVNNIFFPGGTRSRSGKIENKLKLGLLSSVIEAQQYIMEEKIDQKIFIVPMIMSYPFVFEAKPLIKQHLKSVGKEKYQYKKNNISKFRHFSHFMSVMFRKKSYMHIAFGRPMDVLGNYVNDQGESLDNKGNRVEVDSYFQSTDGLNKDTQRESIYTRILADKILVEYLKENRILASEVIAYTAFKVLELDNKPLDIFGIFKTPVDNWQINKDDFLKSIEIVFEALKKKKDEGNLKFSKFLNKTDINPELILNEGMSQLGIYHPNKALVFKNKKELASEDFRLLYYYHNKVDCYELNVSLSQLKT